MQNTKKNDYHLIEQGVERAVWNAELSEESNSGAHANSEKFVKASGSYGKIEDQSVPSQRDITTPWATADAKLGAEVSFNAKADV